MTDQGEVEGGDWEESERDYRERVERARASRMSVALDGGLPAAARPARGCRCQAPSPVVFDCPHAARLQHSCRHGLGLRCASRAFRTARAVSTRRPGPNPKRPLFDHSMDKATSFPI